MISFFIPIRKNSKRIINKNLKPLPGYKFGLTEIKINQLKKIIKKNFLKKKVEIVVSTDSEKIINFLKKYSWIKVFKRNKSLSSDDSLDKLIKYVPTVCKGDYILWTHVTSPLFNENDYKKFINEFFKRKKNIHKSAFSADKIQKFLYREDKKWISHETIKKKWPRTQDLLKCFVINSAAFIASREVYIKNNDRLCDDPLPIENRFDAGFDIDFKNDFNLLKKKMKYKL